MLQFMGSQRVRHDLATEQEQKCLKLKIFIAIDNISESQIKCKLMTNKANIGNITRISSD